MNILDFFRSSRPKTASVAKERLKIILAHEHAHEGGPEFLPLLQNEILEVVRKYVSVDTDAVKVQFGQTGETDVLELNIALPDEAEQAAHMTQ